MKKITLALALTLSCAAASAAPTTSLRPPVIDRPVTLPENVAICGGGGLVAGAVLSGTGIGAAPALVLLALCAIIVDDIRWHAAGNTHN